MTMNKQAIDLSLSLETIFDIDAFNGKKIWVCCNRANDTPSDKAVLLCHGLTGQPNEYIHMMGRDYFTARGYDVYRLAFYWDGPQYRSLKDCTLDIHGRDINAVLAHIQQIHEKTFVCGHSYGGASILFANPDANAVAFWDASFDPWNSFWKDSATAQDDGTYALDWNCWFIVGAPMVEEARDLYHAAEKAAAVTAPALVVEAGAGSMRNECRDLFDSLTVEKDYYKVEGATHCFTDGLTVFDLLDATHKWFEKY